MRVLGLSELGRRAQQMVRDAPQFQDVLAVEVEGGLHFYRYIVPPDDPAWQGYYSLWAKIEPVAEGQRNYRLAHYALTGQWQQLDVEGSLENCMYGILYNRYHLFFG